MFKKILILFIEFTEYILKELKDVYDETYGVDDLTKQAYEEIRYRLEINKSKTLNTLENSIIEAFIAQYGFLPPGEQVAYEANEIFNRDKKQGLIDIMNNLIDRKEQQ